MKTRILFLDEIPRGRRIYIYGAGVNGRTLRAVLAAAQFDEVAAFLDTTKSGVVDGLRCLDLDAYLGERDDADLILVASQFFADMNAELVQRGIHGALEATHVWSVLLHHELASEERFLRLHQPPGAAFDVGANAGFVARLLRRRAAEVHVFEPNERLRPELERSFAGFDGFHLVPQAVSDRVGEAVFHISDDNNGTESSLVPRLGISQREVRVRTTTIDAYCEETGVVPSAIKVDVESFEPAVIRGGWTTIEQHRPLLLIEFQEAHTDTAYREMLADLAKLYRVVRVPWLDDPNYGEGYVDAPAYYRDKNPGRGVTNLGCLPLAK